MPEAHDLVIVGGGVAGLDLATHLAGCQVNDKTLRVTLVDRETSYVWKPMLHTIAAGTQEAELQQTSFVSQARERGFIYSPGAISAIDLAARRIRLDPWMARDGREILEPREVAYDTLVLAYGSRANDFGTEGVAEHCYTIDARSEAVAFNDEVRLRLLQALARRTQLRITIVGGGATGVQLAAELVRLTEQAEHYGAAGTREIVSITLVESGDRLLTAFPDRISAESQQRLEGLGVTVHTKSQVAAAEASGFRLADGRFLDSEIMVWAAGVRAACRPAGLDGLELNRSDQVVVSACLQATRDGNVFALGDCSSLTLPGESKPLPPTAQVANQQAVYLGQHLPGLLEGKTAPDFHFHDFGALVSLGGYDAFGSLGRLGFFKGGFIQGRVAQLGHAMLYRRYQARLHGFWKGSLLWLADQVASRVRPSIRVD
ncbi:MAG: NAD(P)/FAD-dependent oxidoreductase [Janthinobacterium lividum]